MSHMVRFYLGIPPYVLVAALRTALVGNESHRRPAHGRRAL